MAITGAQLIAEVEALAKQSGDKYFYGGTSASTGFDCSGLIYAALQSLGYKNPPRTSEAQYGWVTHITNAQLQPGDLVFAQFPGDNAPPGHVGIYIGGGQIFSAEDPQLGIGISSLSSWAGNIVGYGRVPASTTSADTTADVTALGGGILSFPGEITGFFGDAKTFIDALLWIVNPASWLRIGSFGIAIILLIVGVYALMSVGSDEPLFKMPQVVPVPV
jgi:NlpC/P60 family